MKNVKTFTYLSNVVVRHMDNQISDNIIYFENISCYNFRTINIFQGKVDETNEFCFEETQD